MNIENLFGKPQKEKEEAEELLEALQENDSLNQRGIDKFTDIQKTRIEKAGVELERLQNASNDEDIGEIEKSVKQ